VVNIYQSSETTCCLYPQGLPKNNILQKPKRENSKSYIVSATKLFCCVSKLFYKNIVFKLQMWTEILKNRTSYFHKFN